MTSGDLMPPLPEELIENRDSRLFAEVKSGRRRDTDHKLKLSVFSLI